MAKPHDNVATEITGRCYCGRTTICASQRPHTVAYCHCPDCRRVTGAPVAVFAGFDDKAVTFTPNDGQKVIANPGVERTFCGTCGSPLSGRYAYLPGQVYIAIGVLDQAADLAPHLHAHTSHCLGWLKIDDDLQRFATTARSQLGDTDD